MSKWKWIAQDLNGEIFKFNIEPILKDWGFMNKNMRLKHIEIGNQNQNFANTLTNLETEDYKINDGILTRIPRKTELDKLIAKVKKIDKKAAKWMNKNRNMLDDINDLNHCFIWNDCPKYEWGSIYDRLAEMEDPQEIKETLKYRIGFGEDKGKKYLMLAANEACEVLIGVHPQFKNWLTDWIEVEV